MLKNSTLRALSGIVVGLLLAIALEISIPNLTIIGILIGSSIAVQIAGGNRTRAVIIGGLVGLISDSILAIYVAMGLPIAEALVVIGSIAIFALIFGIVGGLISHWSMKDGESRMKQPLSKTTIIVMAVIVIASIFCIYTGL